MRYIVLFVVVVIVAFTIIAVVNSHYANEIVNCVFDGRCDDL